MPDELERARRAELSQQWVARLDAIAQAPGFPQLTAAHALANAYLLQLAAAQVITAAEAAAMVPNIALMAQVRAISLAASWLPG